MEVLQINTILIVAILLCALFFIYFIFKQDPDKEETEEIIDKYSFNYLCENIKILFNEIINQNITELYLNKRETKKREQQKARLIKALRSCAQGNIGEKEYVKDYIKDLLQNYLDINEMTINNVIPFDNPELLTAQDKFEILLCQYKAKYRFDAFIEISRRCNFEREKVNEFGIHYEIDSEDIHNAYTKLAEPLTYITKLEVVTQRIYQLVYGFSVIDELRDQKIDGVSGGVSGVTAMQYNFMEEIMKSEDVSHKNSYDSVWIFLHGKAIHLSFLTFGEMSELIRVCKNLYRYDNIGHLTSTNGSKLNYLQDGSRVVVVRPKLSSGWAFFIRKFDSANRMPIEKLLIDENKEKVVELAIWAIKGMLNVIISGDQNSGKTTFLKALIRYIDQRYTIRTTEQEFELWLNNLYPNTNIKSFRGSEEISLIDVINLQKKMDSDIMILGEVNSFELANAYVAISQAGTKATFCTCHCVTTRDLIEYFRNAVLSTGTLKNEKDAEKQAANSINLDIHWVKTNKGHRYISHITEVIPLEEEETWPEDFNSCLLEALKRIATRRTYTTREIVVYEDGKYVFKNPLSERAVNKICANLSDQDKELFLEFNKSLGVSHG